MSDRPYRLVRGLFGLHVGLFYARVEVEGLENVPPEGPVILVANHPNSLADACLLATRVTERKVDFIAKDTLMRAPVVGWLLRRIGIIGVARPQEYDRRRDLARERNRLAVEACVPRLRSGEVVAIYGEGVSTGARRLHTIRKGRCASGTRPSGRPGSASASRGSPSASRIRRRNAAGATS